MKKGIERKLIPFFLWTCHYERSLVILNAVKNLT